MNERMITKKVHFNRGQRSRKQLSEGDSPNVPQGRIPRVAKIMALAIRFDSLIRRGVVADQAELARLGHVSRARLTQIMNLQCLAPDIQEEILLLPATERGRDAVTEKQVRPIAALADWRKQRRMFRKLRLEARYGLSAAEPKDA